MTRKVNGCCTLSLSISGLRRPVVSPGSSIGGVGGRGVGVRTYSYTAILLFSTFVCGSCMRTRRSVLRVSLGRVVATGRRGVVPLQGGWGWSAGRGPARLRAPTSGVGCLAPGRPVAGLRQGSKAGDWLHLRGVRFSLCCDLII